MFLPKPRRFLLFLVAITVLRIPVWSQPSTVDLLDYGRLLRIIGERSGERFGISLEIAHLPGRSRPSILIGADVAENAQDDDQVGRVYLFDGESLIQTGLIDLLFPAPGPKTVFYGEPSNGSFGNKMKVGDYNGDNLPDIAIAAPTWGSNGRVYLFFGGVPLPNSGQSIWDTGGDIEAINAHVIFEGTDRELPGQALAAGDLNGDGIDELILGAPNSYGGQGRVYVIRGQSFWTTPAVVFLSETLDAPANKGVIPALKNDIRVYRGTVEDQALGDSLATGDPNGDGRIDLIIGADHESVVYESGSGRVNLLDVGRVHVIAGAKVFPIQAATSETPLTLEVSDLTITGKSEFDLFGDEILVTRWNSDTLDDLWIGSPFAEKELLGNELDDNGIVSLVLGSPSFYTGAVKTSEKLFDYATNWHEENYQPEDLVKQIGADLFPPLAAGEIRFPTGMVTAILGPTLEPLFGGSLWASDILSAQAGTELVVGASRHDPDDNQDAGVVSVFSRADLAGFTATNPYEFELGHESIRIRGENEMDRLGFRVRSADLFDTPGEELILSAPLAASNLRSAGVVYIFNPAALSVPVGAEVTPTYVETPTPLPTLTPTVTPTHTAAATLTPTPGLPKSGSDAIPEP